MFTLWNTLHTKINSPGGIEPQPIKLEFTIYPAELWIYFRFHIVPTAHLDLLFKELGLNYFLVYLGVHFLFIPELCSGMRRETLRVPYARMNTQRVFIPDPRGSGYVTLR